MDSLLPSEDTISLAEIACTDYFSMSDFFYHEEGTESSFFDSTDELSEIFAISKQHFDLSLRSSTLPHNVNLCKRLYYLIPEAVSLLEKFEFEPGRLERLRKLIPENPSFPLSGKFVIKNTLFIVVT